MWEKILEMCKNYLTTACHTCKKSEFNEALNTKSEIRRQTKQSKMCNNKISFHAAILVICYFYTLEHPSTKIISFDVPFRRQQKNYEPLNVSIQKSRKKSISSLKILSTAAVDIKDEKAEIKQFQMVEASHHETVHALIVFHRAPFTLPPHHHHHHHQSLIF